ncbi:MAG: hypothetical protein RLZZ352_1267 [Pseudomonadota bacterium]|jgi:hypothetical protein
MHIINFTNLKSLQEDVRRNVHQRISFRVDGVSGSMSDAVSIIEKEIESQGLSCRIYTAGRIAATGASFLGGLTAAAGIASAIGIAAHNLATLNPDYEVKKHKIDGAISVNYEKSESKKS